VDNSWIYALIVWGLKEAYQSFVGSRAKTIDALTQAQKDIGILQVELKNATLKLDRIESGVSRLESGKRVYRD